MKTTFLLLSLLCLPFLFTRESLALTAGMGPGADVYEDPEANAEGRPSRNKRRFKDDVTEIAGKLIPGVGSGLANSNPFNLRRRLYQMDHDNVHAHDAETAMIGALGIRNYKALQAVNNENHETLQSFATSSGINCEEQNFSPAEACAKPQYSLLADFSDLISLKSVMSNVFKLPKAPLTRSSACSCLKENLKPKASEQEIKKIREDLAQNVRTELNKKLLDEYSKHIEDFHYFYWSSNEFHKKLGRRKKLNNRSMLLCSNGQSYLTSFDNHPKCQGRNLSLADKERKISAVFESFGMSLNGSLDQNLGKLKTDILGQESFDCSKDKSSRYCHDQERYVLSKSAGRGGDIVLTRILKSTDYKDKILKSPELKGLSPVEALSNIFKNDLEGFNRNMLGILTPDVIGDELYQLINRSFSSQTQISEEDKKKIFDEINLIVSTSILHHPGIERILKDRTLFEEVSGKIGKSNSVMDYLENEADFMSEFFEKNCEKIRENVAESICSDNEELLEQIGERDLLELIHSSEVYDERSKNVIASFACDKEETSPDLLNNLVVNPKIQRTSDYFQEKMLKAEDRNSSKASLARLRENPKYADFVASLNESFGESFVTASPGKGGFFDGIDDLATAQLKTAANGNSGNEFTSLTNYVSARDNLSEGQADQMNPIYSVPTAQSSPVNQVRTPVEDEKVSMKKELKEFLRRKGNTDEDAEKIVDNASDDVLKELAALREEMAKNQKKLLELSAENERIKLESMKKKLDDMEKDRAALEPGDSEERVSNSSKSKSYLQPSLKNIGRNIAPAAGDVGGSTGGGTAGTSGADAGKIGDGNNTLSSSARSSGRKPASESSDSPVVISATSAKNGAIEIRSQEVGLDLLNHLSNNGSDIQTLINLKTSGIIYRYKVLENGKEVEKEVLIEYSKLNEDIKKIIDKKIAENKDRKKEVLRLDKEIKELQRVYSYSTLQFILAEQMKQKSNPGQ